MSYQTRNIIILSCFLGLILLLSGYFNLFRYPHRINRLNRDIKNLQTQIAALDGIEDEYIRLEKLIKTQEARLSTLDKRIAFSVSPASTYQYLNSILQHSGVLEFNLYFVEKKTAKGYHYNVFRLKGEGSFARIYRFVSYLEKGPEFYRINKLKLNMMEDKDPETGQIKINVPFNMELHAMYAEVDNLPPIRRTISDVHPQQPTNPFYPYIKGNVPPNSRNRLEVERAELKAVLPDKAMIADHRGKIHLMKQGDPVYLGYLSKINLDKNEVEFVLNKGGIVEKYVLQLRFDKEIK